jgi:multidrug efflux pump subunit AcrB
MMMFRTIGIVVVCLCLIAGAGLYFKWFTITASTIDSRTPDLHLSIDKDKVDKDVKTAKEELNNLLGDKTVEGTIRDIETAKEELTIRDSRNQDVRMKLDPATKIKIIDKAGSFSDLKTADPVSVTYETKKDGNVARTITVAKKL